MVTLVLEGLSPGVSVEEGYFSTSDGVSLRTVTFTPPAGTPQRPPVVFLPGWISAIEGWSDVLEVLTAEHPVLYVETREKASARLPERRGLDFSMDRLCADLDELVADRLAPDEPFCFFGSSLGSTLILEYLGRGGRRPLLAVLVAPNLVFRLPRWVVIAARTLPASAFTLLRPIMKWYLCSFMLDAEREPEQAERYRRNLDTAEPWRLRANALELKDYSAWERLPRVRAPVLIVAGASDSLHHLDDMRKMVSVMPDARLEVLESNREAHSERMGRIAVREIGRAMAPGPGGSEEGRPR